MYSPELLKDLLFTIEYLKKELAGPDPEKVSAVQEAYHKLLDDFYEEYQAVMAPVQYRAAKDDPDSFVVLIRLAYYDQESEKGEKMHEHEQSVSCPDWKLFTRI